MAERKQARNIYADKFAEMFEQTQGMPYQITTADMVQLDAITNKGEIAKRMTVEVFTRGCQNYFSSELGIFSLKHLCPNFVAYWKSSLDRYGKPKEKASQVGGANPISEQTIAAYSWHPRFLHAAFKVGEKTKAFDAIDELFGQIAEGLSEVEAFKRLKEIEQLRAELP